MDWAYTTFKGTSQRESSSRALCQIELQLISVSIRLRLTEAAAFADDYILIHGRPKTTQKPLWDPPSHQVVVPELVPRVLGV